MFLLYETINGLVIWSLIPGFFEAKDEKYIWRILSESIIMLIYLSHSIKHTWCHVVYTYCIFFDVS